MPDGLAVDLAVAHISDRTATKHIADLLADLHGSEYEFAVRHVRGSATLYPVPGRLTACFLMETREAGLNLFQGDLVKRPEAGFRFRLGTRSASMIEPDPWPAFRANWSGSRCRCR